MANDAPLLVSLNDCSMAFGEKSVVNDVTLSVAKGDFVMLTGPNGGGKTTLLRLMAGLLKPTHGTVDRRPGIVTGYLPQFRKIDRQFPITVEQAVLSGLNCRKHLWQSFGKEHRQAATEALQAVGIGSLAARPISSLSGGQWQKTLIARAIVARPDLLLLDEPETYLDASSKANLYGILEGMHATTGIVMVSHEASISKPTDGRIIYRVENRQAELI